MKGKNMKTKIVVLGLILFVSKNAAADIARPDAIIYGVLKVGDSAVGEENANAASAYLIIARVDGIEQPVSVYRMGDQPSAGDFVKGDFVKGDRYVLHIAHAFEDDGKTPSENTARAGDLAKLYVLSGDGFEVLLGEVNIPKSGEVLRKDLSATPGDLAGHALPAGGSGTCGGGGGMCGAMGMISFAMMFLGLVQMKHRHRRRRQTDLSAAKMRL